MSQNYIPEDVHCYVVARWLSARPGSFKKRPGCAPGLSRVYWVQDYYNKAPHLLGLLRFYAVGKTRRSTSKPKMSPSDLMKMESTPLSAGAIELAEMGIFLTANETTELPDMGLNRKWIVLAELSMAPLSLNDAHARWLVNMAALELCKTPDFFGDDTAEVEDSASRGRRA